MNSEVWHRRTALTWHGTLCCGCQQSVTPFDRWIRALLASTELKADGHMTSGLVLTQLKEGGRLGAYHHMPPYLFPLGVVPFHFHSRFSRCLSILPCDFNHKALKWRCASGVFYFKPNISFHLLFSAQTEEGFLEARSIVYGSKSPWLMSHSDRNQCCNQPSAGYSVSIFYLAVPGKLSCTQYFHEPCWTLPHLAGGITVSRSTCFTDSTWHCEKQWQWSSSCRYYCGICVHTWGTQHGSQFQPKTTLFLHKPSKIFPVSSTATLDWCWGNIRGAVMLADKSKC